MGPCAPSLPTNAANKRPIGNTARFIDRRRLDFAWPHARVGIEVDGHDWHEGFEALERDVSRSNFYLDQDWKVLRITRRIMRTQGVTFALELPRLLGQPELRL
jgi:very-short-patch-repair endonuclease